ncbi:MAG: glycosyltransferase family 2 protein [Ignavibacteriaceae bacterium]
MIPLAVKKYLQKYSFSNWRIELSEFEGIENAVVIPAICEYGNLMILLSSFVEMDPKYFNSTLVVFVVNNLASSSMEIKKENEKTLSVIRSILNKDLKTGIETVDNVILSGLKVGLVDAASGGKELPEKDGGVGLARKLGMDLALSIFDFKSNNKKILICLDADCTVEKNYLTEIVQSFNRRNLSASVVNYEHRLNEDKETTAAIVCYEIFLRFYVLGLKYAKSPYALHTVGSTMICDFEAYIKVEGMNKKKAAEDFYFLEKLAKNVTVEKIGGTTVYPASRKSWRVPFGTGQRVSRFLSNVQDEYLLYDPKSFYILRDWLKVFHSLKNVNAKIYLKSAEKIDKNLFNFLTVQDFEMNWNKIVENSSGEKQLSVQKMRWFDGFRTLKLIHFLRDSEYPLINMFDALDEMFKHQEITSLPDRNNILLPSIKVQIEYLKTLRELT